MFQAKLKQHWLQVVIILNALFDKNAWIEKIEASVFLRNYFSSSLQYVCMYDVSDANEKIRYNLGACLRLFLVEERVKMGQTYNYINR